MRQGKKGEFRLAQGATRIGTARVRLDALKDSLTAVSNVDSVPNISDEVAHSRLPMWQVGSWPAIGRLNATTMNKTESRYALHLEQQLRAGDLLWFRFEGLKFRLAKKTFYTPDFAVMRSTRELECHEVKGFWEDDARVKIKVVAELYPLRFIAVRPLSERDGAGWAIEEF